MKVILESHGHRAECDARTIEEGLTGLRSTRLWLARPENWDTTGDGFATVVDDSGHIVAAGRVVITRVGDDVVEAVSNGSFDPLDARRHMRVGWLADDPGYVGGAELTMAEFKAIAPKEVEVVDCPPGNVVPGLDRYVIGNCLTYSLLDPEEMGDAPKFRYHHDTNPGLALRNTKHIYCSPLQRDKMKAAGTLIPPALDLTRFDRAANGNQKGAVCIGRMAYGKGLELLAEHPEPVDVYSTVPFASEGNARYKGAAEDVARTLKHYETFVFLPTALEPFGRAVVEAWAAGLVLKVNRNVGALHWIVNAQGKLKSAGKDFWRLVLRG